jgi:hypothetical protein
VKYIRVEWKHDDPRDPIVIYSEIDEAQCEHRKIEVFRDGRQGHADRIEAVGGTTLGLEPWPDLAKLGAEPEFEVADIGAGEFERLWLRRHERV